MQLIFTSTDEVSARMPILWKDTLSLGESSNLHSVKVEYFPLAVSGEVAGLCVSPTLRLRSSITQAA